MFSHNFVPKFIPRVYKRDAVLCMALNSKSVIKFIYAAAHDGQYSLDTFDCSEDKKLTML